MMDRHEFKTHRKSLFPSQGAAARAFGVAQSCLSQWELGKRRLPKMAQTLLIYMLEREALKKFIKELGGTK